MNGSPGSLNTSSRQLAAIMFTDIVGYTALMGEDEQKAFDLLRKNRDIQRPLIEQFGGRWIKELGDGVMATFANATDAVLCAGAIQKACSNISDLKLRIGINLGEVVFEDNDVFGDGVNIASRLQTLAPIGGIFISESVQKNISNKKGIATIFIREELLKNVRTPVQIFEVDVNSVHVENPQVKLYSQDRKRPVPAKSIAVLAFDNIGNDPEQEYFSDGMAEEILNVLSNLKDLKVVGRASSFQFKGKNIDLREIGLRLGVKTVLEGSVRRQAIKLRIMVKLTDVEDGYHMWSERYDREMIDVFEIQDDISLKIAEKLKVTFFGDYHVKSERVPTLNMKAYEYLLQGKFFLDKYVEGFEKAFECFNKAIELDPDYAEAYVELARLYFLCTMFLFYKPHDGFEKAKLYAEKALALDNDLGGAHYVLGQVYFWYNWDWERAKKEYEAAENSAVAYYFTGIEIDPWYPAFLYGDFDAAIQSMHKMIERDPLSFNHQLQLGYFLTYGKRPEHARKVLNNIISAVPSFSDAVRLKAISYFFEGDNENAVLYARRAAELAQGKGWSQNFLIIALARSGAHEEARKLLAEWQANPFPCHIPPTGLSIIYANLGEFDKAFEYLQEAFLYRDSWMVSLKVSGDFDPLRSDPRFAKILEHMNFPDRHLP